MTRRQAHPKPDGEKVLKDAEKHGCRITKGKKYFKVWCACGSDWMTIPLTPSNPYTFQNKHAKMTKWSCWTEEGVR